MNNKESNKRMNKEDRRKQILDAALAVFVEKGFKGSTTLEIAKKADIAEVTLFRYFSSKKEIFLESIEPILISTLEVNIKSSNELHAFAKLEHLLYERIKLISKNYQVVKLILTEASFLSELGNDNFTNRIIEILKTMLMQIGISINDEDFTIRLFMGSMLSFLYMPEKNEETIKNYVNKVVSLILQENNKQEKG